MRIDTVKHRRGFSLVEILIVVVILAILAVIVLPEFSSASASARASMLMDDLRLMRSQIVVFKAQHRGVSPGYPNCDTGQLPTAEALADHITKSSNEGGETAEPGTPGYRYGPYMRQFPQNPVNGRTTVRMIADGAQFPNAPQDQYGWIYQAETLIFKADSTGTDEQGRSYFDY
jgi:prepilin-type N-terminal cleavage/methylation domain-containing protein